MNKRDIRIIESFINNELDKEQLEWFQQRLKEDKSFAKEYKLQADLQKALNEEDIIDLREKLNKISSVTTQVNRPTRKLHKNKFLFAAASLAFLIIGGIGFYSYLSKPGSAEIYNTYYQAYEANSWIRSADKLGKDMLDRAITRYEKEDYSSAKILFKNVLENDNDNLPALFYGGIASMETGDYQAAINNFNDLLNRGHSLFEQQTKWYLGLCYLKTENTRAAREIFLELGSESEYYKSKAKEILKHL